MSGEWSDFRKWWAELLKNLVSFAIIAALTVFFINKLEDNRQQANFKWQAAYGVKVEVLRSFETESKRYVLVGYDAIREYTCGNNRHNSEVIQNWEDERYDSLKIARESLEYWFSVDANPNLKDAIAAFSEAQAAIRGVKDHAYLTDCDENKSWQVKMHQDEQWEKFDAQSFRLKRKAYYESINQILKLAAQLL